jgi:hypothetical protein
MKRFIGGAFALALLATLAPAPAAAGSPESDEIEIYVVNSHVVPVRVFVEDAEGQLHSLGRIASGEVSPVEVPAEIAGSEYRLKFVPAPIDVWSPVSDDVALKTRPLSSDEVRLVTVWIEPELERSDVEVLEAFED